MSIKAELVDDKSKWESFIETHTEANFLQSWYWGEFHKTLGKTITRTGFFKNKKLVGAMLSIVEPAKRARHLIIPGGPIINWGDKEVVGAFVSSAKEIAQNNQCVFVRVRPQLIENEVSKKIFANHGFREAPMHLTADLTSQLDLAQDEDELLANMRKNTRYEIKQAQKSGLVIKTSKNPIDIKDFYEIQLYTAKRQGFVPFSYEFLHEQFKIFVADDKALLYKAYKDDMLLTEAFIIFYGAEATYHYGVSTAEGRNYPGSYLIQWEAIREAKRTGMKRYNFWGVEKLDDLNHRFYGVSVFKRGFGGQDVQYLHAQDLIVDLVRYFPNYVLEIVRRKVRRL